MTEYIGSRISLISKRDIRYVGTLHEISSENSTVALEQVVSCGTEDRVSNPAEFVPKSDRVYEYIVFRGSDVKDLRIERSPEQIPTDQPQVPDDPAILGSARPAERAPATATPKDHVGASTQSPEQNGQFPQQYNRQHDHQGPPPSRFPQQNQYPYNFPPNPRFGPQGPPGPPGPHGFGPYGQPGMPFGPPPGWYPPPGHGFPQGPPGQFYPNQQIPFNPPGPPIGSQRPTSKPQTPAEAMANEPPPQQSSSVEKQSATVKLPTSSTTSAATAAAPNGPPPPTDSKPDVAAALAPPTTVNDDQALGAKPANNMSKSGRIMPAIPIVSATQKAKPISNGNAAPPPGITTAKQGAPAPGTIPMKTFEDANRDARAAVAAAMAKLPPSQAQAKKQSNGDTRAIDNLVNKVNEMRADDTQRPARQAGHSGYTTGGRGGSGRGGFRGGRPRNESQTKKVEVPKTDYDFASANAKFNKEDFAREALVSESPSTANTPSIEAGEPSAEDGSRKESVSSVVIPPAPSYNKTSSFFDNISSESKDREDATSKKLGGREFRSEETKKNFETFGQGSVDNRGGYRGRGRGRGYRGGRGRGGRGRGTLVTET